LTAEEPYRAELRCRSAAIRLINSALLVLCHGVLIRGEPKPSMFQAEWAFAARFAVQIIPDLAKTPGEI
jgi:hypothetical protein